ncbi:hypothetical protein [Actinomadura nitritigenes]|uniref:hypothetical protein n=1 Tax=Actinomadura nitritigenes TaxID=134602 RepID=UPI003D931D40
MLSLGAVGGGSIIDPVLVGRGMPVAQVAPAFTCLTSLTSATALAALYLLQTTGRPG